ncbi:MAG: sulfatase [Mariniphaga sp.]|nr:sulfatase [Mariniphaga sp.]
MKKKKLVKSVVLASVTIQFLLFFSGCNQGMEQNDYHPVNVLLITADDLNYNSVGCYGCPVENITPNIDKLAQSGIRFTNAFVNIAVCQPSRQSIMTGRYPHNNGAPGFDPIDTDVVTLQEQLRDAGYINGILGKEIHLKPTNKYCWDFYIREGDLSSGLGIGRDPELYYKYSQEFFNRAASQNKPFFLMANAHDPHRPFAGSEQEMRAWGEDLPAFRRQILPKEVTIPDFLPDLPEIRLEISEYYTSVYRMDEVVGAVLKALDESGLSDNTIVMFISDNGMAVPFAKSNCYINSNKTPWIVRWPGQVEAGSVDSIHFISGIDYMPTILHALRLPVVPDMDGGSFLPLLQGENQNKRNVVFTEFNRIYAGIDYSMRCVQEENYGYIVNFWSDGKHAIRGDATSGRTFSAMQKAAATDEEIADRLNMYVYRVPEELYNFGTDPDGLVNLINDPSLNEVKQRLKKMVYLEMKKTNDPLLYDFEKRFLSN